MANDPRATLLKLLDALRELDVKRDAIYAEMDVLLKGGEGLGAKLARLKKAYADAWQTRYLSPYTFTNHAMVGASFKRLITAGFGEAEIIARMFTYLKSDESFYVRARHPFEIFVKGFNSFVGLPASTEEAKAEDSMQKLREMREGA